MSPVSAGVRGINQILWDWAVVCLLIWVLGIELEVFEGAVYIRPPLNKISRFLSILHTLSPLLYLFIISMWVYVCEGPVCVSAGTWAWHRLHMRVWWQLAEGSSLSCTCWGELFPTPLPAPAHLVCELLRKSPLSSSHSLQTCWGYSYAMPHIAFR